MIKDGFIAFLETCSKEDILSKIHEKLIQYHLQSIEEAVK